MQVKDCDNFSTYFLIRLISNWADGPSPTEGRGEIKGEFGKGWGRAESMSHVGARAWAWLPRVGGEAGMKNRDAYDIGKMLRGWRGEWGNTWGRIPEGIENRVPIRLSSCSTVLCPIRHEHGSVVSDDKRGPQDKRGSYKKRVPEGIHRITLKLHFRYPSLNYAKPRYNRVIC